MQLLAPAEEISEEDWDETIAVNLKAPFFCAQAAAKHFIARGGGGKIVNITSIWAEVGFPLFSAYCAAKGGLLLMTRALTSEWGQYGINVNAVGPTLNVTDMTRELAEDEEFSRDYMHKLPPGRFGDPAEVADAVVFLASPGIGLRLRAAADGRRRLYRDRPPADAGARGQKASREDVSRATTVELRVCRSARR